MKTLFEKVIILFFTIFLCLSLLEIGLNAMGRKPSNMTDGIFVKHGNSYRLGKNISKSTQWPAYSYMTYTNSFGFRDKQTGERNINEKPYFVFLGASVVFAMGVNYEDSFVGKFAANAEGHGIEVLNLAVGGHYFDDQENLFIDFTKNTARKPSKVFICLSPLAIFNYDCKYENLIVKNGYIFHERAYRLAYVRIILGNLSSAYCFFRDRVRNLQAKWIKTDVIDNSSYLDIYSKHNRMHNLNNIKQLETYLQRFEKYCYEIGVTPIYVYIPLVSSFRLNEILITLGKDPRDYDTTFYEKLLEKHCLEQRIIFLNPKTILKDLYDKGIPLRFKQDAHYNKFAHHAVGEYIVNQIFLRK